MIPGRIENATRHLGKPSGWNDAEHGVCAVLPVRDEVVDGLPQMTSVWMPTPDEALRIARGAPVYLTVIGTSHPPVSLAAGKVPG